MEIIAKVVGIDLNISGNNFSGRTLQALATVICKHDCIHSLRLTKLKHSNGLDFLQLAENLLNALNLSTLDVSRNKLSPG